MENRIKKVRKSMTQKPMTDKSNTTNRIKKGKEISKATEPEMTTEIRKPITIGKFTDLFKQKGDNGKLIMNYDLCEFGIELVDEKWKRMFEAYISIHHLATLKWDKIDMGSVANIQHMSNLTHKIGLWLWENEFTKTEEWIEFYNNWEAYHKEQEEIKKQKKPNHTLKRCEEAKLKADNDKLRELLEASGVEIPDDLAVEKPLTAEEVVPAVPDLLDALMTNLTDDQAPAPTPPKPKHIKKTKKVVVKSSANP